MNNLFEVGKTYKIEDFNQSYYTATIISENDQAIYFTDKHGHKGGLSKMEIKRWKEVQPNE